jgi:hypothetical protein
MMMVSMAAVRRSPSLQSRRTVPFTSLAATGAHGDWIA